MDCFTDGIRQLFQALTNLTAPVAAPPAVPRDTTVRVEDASRRALAAAAPARPSPMAEVPAAPRSSLSSVHGGDSSLVRGGAGGPPRPPATSTSGYLDPRRVSAFSSVDKGDFGTPGCGAGGSLRSVGAGCPVSGYGGAAFGSSRITAQEISPFVRRMRPLAPGEIRDQDDVDTTTQQSFVRDLCGKSHTIYARSNAQVAEYIQTVIHTMVENEGRQILDQYKRFRLVSYGKLIAEADNKGNIFQLPSDLQSSLVKEFAPHGTMMHIVLSKVTEVNCDNLLALREFLVRGHMGRDFAVVLSSSENTLYRLYTRCISGGAAIGIEIESVEEPSEKLTIRFTADNKLLTGLTDPENIWRSRLETFIESVKLCPHAVENPSITEEQFFTFVDYLKTQTDGFPLTDHLGVEYCMMREHGAAPSSFVIAIWQLAPEDRENRLEFLFDEAGNLQSITDRGVDRTLEDLLDQKKPRSQALYACFHRLQVKGLIPKEVDHSFNGWTMLLPKLLLKGGYGIDRPFRSSSGPRGNLFIAPDIMYGVRVYLDTQDARLAMIFDATGRVVGAELNGFDYTDRFKERNDYWKGFVFAVFKEIFAEQAVFYADDINTLWVHPNTLEICPKQLAIRLNSFRLNPGVTRIRFLNDLLEEGPALDVGGLSREFFSSLAPKLFNRSTGVLARREDAPYRPYVTGPYEDSPLGTTLALSISYALLSPFGVKLGSLFDRDFYEVIKAVCTRDEDLRTRSFVLGLILPETSYREQIVSWFAEAIFAERRPNPSTWPALRTALLEMCTVVYYLDPPIDQSVATLDAYLTHNLKDLFKNQIQEALFIKALCTDLRGYRADSMVASRPTAEALQIAVEGVAFTAADILRRMRVDEAMMENYVASAGERVIFQTHYVWIQEIINEHRDNPEWLAQFVQFMTGQNNAPRDTEFKFAITRQYTDSRTRASRRGEQFHIHTCSARLDIPPLAGMTKEGLLYALEALIASRGYNAD